MVINWVKMDPMPLYAQTQYKIPNPLAGALKPPLITSPKSKTDGAFFTQERPQMGGKTIANISLLL